MDFPEYQIRRSKRAKHMRLTIRNQSEVILTLPRLVPEFLGHQFVRSKRKWILGKIKTSVVNDEKEKVYKDGDHLTLFGAPVITLKLQNGVRKKFDYIDNVLTLTIVQTQDIEYLLEEFYKNVAREYLTAQAEHYSVELGVRFNRLALKNNRTNWGSCSGKKNLNFNWRILLAPKEIVDYLVIHEVCHLREMNHGPKFWALVEHLDPNYQSHQKWLKQNGKDLVL